MQLVNDGGKTPARLVEKVEAALQRFALGSLVSLVYRVVPDLPVAMLVSRWRAREPLPVSIPLNNRAQLLWMDGIVAYVPNARHGCEI